MTKSLLRPSRALTLATAMVFSNSVNAISMQQLFDGVNSEGNVSNPAVLQGQTMNFYTGGSLYMRAPKQTYQLVTATPPSWGAGCGGIDLYLGGFSHINKDQFVAMLKNIGSNAVGYAFKLALQNLCPSCDNIMTSLQAVANQINRLNIDSCEAAKGIVNASKPDAWTKGVQQSTIDMGTFTNVFSDISDAWTSTKNNAPKAGQTLDAAAAAKPELKDSIPKGNVVWKALKKQPGLGASVADDEYRMILMSLVGSAVFNPSDTSSTPKALFPQKIDIITLIRGEIDPSSGKPRAYVNVPIWKCDTTNEDGCLNPTLSVVKVDSFTTMVTKKMVTITEAISTRQPHPDINSLVAFLSVTDFPVYKMLAVTTSFNNTGLAASYINRYQELIAAKYAEVYIRAAVTDLRSAISAYRLIAPSHFSQELDDRVGDLSGLERDARDLVNKAYTETMASFRVVEELQHLERTVNSNLSGPLRNSVAFAKSIK